MPKPSSRPVADLAPDPRNPRRITEAAAAGLGRSMAQFGDLAGITYNKRTSHLVTGHQRMSELRKAGATEWTLDGDRGWIEHPITRERFAVRVVDLSPEEERQANLIANSSHVSGTFTADAIAQLEEISAAGVNLAPLCLDALMDELREAAGQFDAEEVGMPDAPNQAAPGFQQMTFTLTDNQTETVRRALSAATRRLGPFVDTGNENSNGNALAAMAAEACRG